MKVTCRERSRATKFLYNVSKYFVSSYLYDLYDDLVWCSKFITFFHSKK